jgi:hypothetical protein
MTDTATLRAALGTLAAATRGQATVADAAAMALHNAERRLAALEASLAARDEQERASMSSRLRFGR